VRCPTYSQHMILNFVASFLTFGYVCCVRTFRSLGAAFYRQYNPRKVPQAINVLKSYPLYPTREELNKTLR